MNDINVFLESNSTKIEELKNSLINFGFTEIPTSDIVNSALTHNYKFFCLINQKDFLYESLLLIYSHFLKDKQFLNTEIESKVLHILGVTKNQLLNAHKGGTTSYTP